jgi:hypothetical protein
VASIGHVINTGQADFTTIIYGVENVKSQILAKELGYCGHCYLANELVCKGPTYRYHDSLERENKSTLASEGSSLFRHGYLSQPKEKRLHTGKLSCFSKLLRFKSRAKKLLLLIDHHQYATGKNSYC